VELKKTKKLALHRETVRELNDSEMGRVAGARDLRTQICPTPVIYTQQCPQTNWTCIVIVSTNLHCIG
jgi:hypothetical protein